MRSLVYFGATVSDSLLVVFDVLSHSSFIKEIYVTQCSDAYKPFSFYLEGKDGLTTKKQFLTGGWRGDTDYLMGERKKFSTGQLTSDQKRKKTKCKEILMGKVTALYKEHLACSFEAMHSPCINKNRTEVSHYECLGSICFFLSQTNKYMILILAVLTEMLMIPGDMKGSSTQGRENKQGGIDWPKMPRSHKVVWGCFKRSYRCADIPNDLTRYHCTVTLRNKVFAFFIFQ